MEYTIGLLETVLEEVQHSKRKSIQLFSNSIITEETHCIHLSNLNPKIEELEYAIKKLKNGL